MNASILTSTLLKPRLPRWSSCVWWSSSAMRRRVRNNTIPNPPAQTERGFRHSPGKSAQNKRTGAWQVRAQHQKNALYRRTVSYSFTGTPDHDRCGHPGGSILPSMTHCQSTQIRHVLARHEQGAGFIAQGMARTEGKPAVCMACSGPGATNLITAIADARLDSIPLVCITGQVPASMIGTDAFQEVDTYGISIPITKHNYRSAILLNCRR